MAPWKVTSFRSGVNTRTTRNRSASDVVEETNSFAAMGPVIARSEDVRDRINGWTPSVDNATTSAGALAIDVAGIARAAIDAGQAFGVLDTQAGSLLSSVVNVGQSMGKLLAGDLTSIAGVIGGVANIAKQITGGDEIRRALLRENTRNLARLADEVSGLSLNVKGETFAGVQDVLTSIVPTLGKSIGSFGPDMARLFTALQARGLSMADLEKVAQAMGISLRDKNGNFSREALGQLLEGMGMVTPTTPGKSFKDGLDLLTDSFAVDGTSGIGQLSSLFGLGTRSGLRLFDGLFNPSDLAGTRQRLADLFGRFQRGELSAGDLGGLTSAQFRAFMLDLISRTDTLLKGDGGGGSGGGAIPPSAPPGDEEVFVPGVGNVPTAQISALADVFESYALETLPLLTSQLEVQRGILAATEATADNTALTVEELRALRAAIEGGALADQVDRELGARRLNESLRSGLA